MASLDTTVAIIGAGPAGLAVGACLKQAGVDFVILEKEREIGSSWRRHYERLHLHTVKQHSALPFAPFPKDYPRYVPRDLMIRYLDDYAARFDLMPRFGETVQAVRQDDPVWTTDATSGAVRSAYVVIASGDNAMPNIPEFPGVATFKGTLLHSADYRNAAPFTGRSVLVIGMGNTGAEIALDLAENGARPVLSLRGGVHIVPRDLFGIPIQVVAMMATKALPASLNDKVFPHVLDFALGYPGRYGIKRPKQGILAQIASASRIPVIDVGTVRKVAAGAIEIAPNVTAITETGAIFEDGTRRDFDAILFATGFRPNYQSLFEGAEVPRVGADKGTTSAPGLYGVGFNNVVTGLLREIALEAKHVAEDIRRRSSPH